MNNERYKRQILVWGNDGQEKVSNAKVAIVGLGGLGSASAHYLTAAGVGTLGIIDHQEVQMSDLNRQILYDTNSIGKLKTEVAKGKLERLNPEVKIKVINKKLTESNVDVLDEFDIIVDGTDNYDTRFLLNDYCFKTGKAFVFAAAHGLQGSVSVLKENTPCLRCMISKIEPLEVVPIAGITPGLLGLIQSLETLKLIINGKSSLEGYLLVFDGKELDFNKIKIEKNKNCKICQK